MITFLLFVIASLIAIIAWMGWYIRKTDRDLQDAEDVIAQAYIVVGEYSNATNTVDQIADVLDNFAMMKPVNDVVPFYLSVNNGQFTRSNTDETMPSTQPSNSNE